VTEDRARGSDQGPHTHEQEVLDEDVFERIEQLVSEEHGLRRREEDEPLDAGPRQRLERLQVTLDQCWDLLHRRRALRDAGKDPDGAAVRSEQVVEHFEQ
jgi:hypothetical protein